MHLVVYEVVELHVVHDSYRYSVLERLTCTAVVKNSLTVLIDACKLECISDVVLICTVENRCSDLPVKCLSCAAKVYLKELADVHT